MGTSYTTMGLDAPKKFMFEVHVWFLSIRPLFMLFYIYYCMSRVSVQSAGTTVTAICQVMVQMSHPICDILVTNVSE